MHPHVLTDPHQAGEWMMGGCRDRAANRAYGFREADVAQAAVGAYYEAFVTMEGADKTHLKAALCKAFEDAVRDL